MIRQVTIQTPYQGHRIQGVPAHASSGEQIWIMPATGVVPEMSLRPFEATYKVIAPETTSAIVTAPVHVTMQPSLPYQQAQQTLTSHMVPRYHMQ